MDPAEENKEVQPVVVRREPENDLFTWIAPSRPFKTRTREYYVTLFAITGLVGLVLFIAEGAMPVVLLIAITFLFYVLSTVKPEDVEYKITNKGIKVSGKRTDWQVLSRFWFTKRFDSDLLVIETFTLPGRVELLVKEEDKGIIRKHLTAYLPEEGVAATGLEKAANWFSSKLPGNK
ncbi:MAG: hypothetical protein AAB535_01240 [Patescibacteria group bacterium]